MELMGIIACLTVVGCILMGLFMLHTMWYCLRINDFPNRRVKFTSDKKLNGKTVVVTGANSGVGYATAKDFAKRGARVIMACRNIRKASYAKAKLVEVTGNEDVIVMKLDLSDLESVQNFCKNFLAKEKALHILVNNAGLAFSEGVTKQNFDLLVGTNYVGHFLLTHLLLDVIKKSAPSRIINVSSSNHYDCSDPMLKPNDTTGESLKEPKGYYVSKLFNVMHARQLAKELKGNNVQIFSLHPGYVFDGVIANQVGSGNLLFLVFYMLYPFSLSLEEGARTTLYCALEDSIADKSGEYFDNCRVKVPNKLALDEKMCEQVWNVTMEAIKDYTKQVME